MRTFTVEQARSLVAKASVPFRGESLDILAAAVAKLANAREEAREISKTWESLVIFYPATGYYKAIAKREFKPGLEYRDYHIVARFRSGVEL